MQHVKSVEIAKIIIVLCTRNKMEKNFIYIIWFNSHAGCLFLLMYKAFVTKHFNPFWLILILPLQWYQWYGSDKPLPGINKYFTKDTNTFEKMLGIYSQYLYRTDVSIKIWVLFKDKISLKVRRLIQARLTIYDVVYTTLDFSPG